MLAMLKSEPEEPQRVGRLINSVGGFKLTKPEPLLKAFVSVHPDVPLEHARVVYSDALRVLHNPGRCLSTLRVPSVFGVVTKGGSSAGTISSDHALERLTAPHFLMGEMLAMLSRQSPTVSSHTRPVLDEIDIEP